jgi:hypothetical protein
LSVGYSKTRLAGWLASTIGHSQSNAVRTGGRFNPPPEQSAGSGPRRPEHQMCDAAIQEGARRAFWMNGDALGQRARRPQAGGSRCAVLILPSREPFAAFERLSFDTAAGIAAGHAIQPAGNLFLITLHASEVVTARIRRCMVWRHKTLQSIHTLAIQIRVLVTAPVPPSHITVDQ